MKKVFAVIALTIASLAFVACNQKKADANAEAAIENAEAAQEQVAEAAQDAAEAVEAAVIAGKWTAKAIDDKKVETLYTLNFKENNVYDVTTKVGTNDEVAAADQAYTIEGMVVTLADGMKLEYAPAEGKLYILNAEGARAAEGVEGDYFVFTRAE